MSQTERIRLRFDRVFRPGTNEAAVVQYLETIAPIAVQRADLVQDLLCARYLPFALETRERPEDKLQAVHSIYVLESVIQQILVLWGMPDPRFREGHDVAAQDVKPEPVKAMGSLFLADAQSELGAEAVEADAETAEAVEAVEVVEADAETAVDGMRSTVSRMII